MAALGASMTRSSSSDSSSALSNILVAAARETMLEDHSRSSEQGAPASTPPTSLQETASDASASRPRRARKGVQTYNLKELSDRQERNVSGLTGRTLVEGEEEAGEVDGQLFAGKVDKAMDMEWELPGYGEETADKASVKVQRRPSVRDRVKNVAGKVGAALGKRKRDVLEASRRKLRKQKEEGVEEDEEDVKKSKWLRELDMGSKGVLDEMDLDEVFEAPPQRPAKKAKTSGKDVVQESSKPLVPTQPTAAPIKSVGGKGMKRWQRQGLYVGQKAGFDPVQVGGRKKKLQKKNRPESADSGPTTASEPVTSALSSDNFIKLPMFAYLDKTRDFRIPFDIFAPATKKGDEKPKDWHKVNRNRLVGEAKDLWAKVEKLPASKCICPQPWDGSMSCEDDCLNRVMQYECNEDNCSLPVDKCSNRAFAELAARTKKGGAFDVGVEVLKTEQRGFGVRSCRSFAPGQIIMEYTGEIISEGECQRRMREEYKDKQCYYLMELERGLIIDGTKGSMARFINHSCAPNCEVRMVKVNGTPRMAVFAGDAGVMTGEELTYDYNFDNFGTTQQQCFCGAESCRGFLSKRLNAAEMKKQAKEEEVRKRKAAEEAMRAAERDVKKRKVKEERGSGWRGWLAVDDPETKERLREEKRAREEAEKNSSRARRLAARRGSLPAGGAAAPAEAKVAKEEAKKRRRTVQIHQEVRPAKAASAVEDAEHQPTDMKKEPVEDSASPVDAAPATAPPVLDDDNATSAGAPLERPVSTITQRTEVSISTTTEVMQANGAALAGSSAEEKRGLKRTASKGKEVVRKALKGAFGAGGAVAGNGKLKQTTLSFGKAGV